MRAVFFFISLVICILYNVRLSKIDGELKLGEQIYISGLSGVTVLFNNPIYFIGVLHSNWFSSFIEVFFVINYIIMVMAIWIVFTDKILYEES